MQLHFDVKLINLSVLKVSMHLKTLSSGAKLKIDFVLRRRYWRHRWNWEPKKYLSLPNVNY